MAHFLMKKDQSLKVTKKDGETPDIKTVSDDDDDILSFRM